MEKDIYFSIEIEPVISLEHEDFLLQQIGNVTYNIGIDKDGRQLCRANMDAGKIGPLKSYLETLGYTPEILGVFDYAGTPSADFPLNHAGYLEFFPEIEGARPPSNITAGYNDPQWS